MLLHSDVPARLVNRLGERFAETMTAEYLKFGVLARLVDFWEDKIGKFVYLLLF